jgi:hypothetical protein
VTGGWAATNTLREALDGLAVWNGPDAENLAALALVEAALDAADAWWATKRPITWTDAEHAAQPFVNCVGPQEQALAAALRAVREGK